MPMLKRSTIAVIALAVIAAVGPGPVHAAQPAPPASPSTCPPPGSVWSGTNPWCYDWQGQWVQQTVAVPSADGPLAGTVFAPAKIAAGARLPAVAVLHGLSGKQYNMWWLTRFLAGHGYIAVAVTTAGNSAANFQTAM